jgi:hypothetical protein
VVHEPSRGQWLGELQGSHILQVPNEKKEKMLDGTVKENLIIIIYYGPN